MLAYLSEGTDGNPLLLDGLLHEEAECVRCRAAGAMLAAVGLEDILPSSGHNIWLHGAADGDSCSFVRSPVRPVPSTASVRIRALVG